MKKILPVFAFLILLLADSFSQVTFNTGAMEVYVGEYGKLRLYTLAGTENLHLAYILVGTSPTSVFDHENDAEVVDPTVLVSNPASSDFEIYGAYDNSYSGDPPAVLLKEYVYGWNNGQYTIVKYNIKNIAATSITALLGLEIFPKVNGEYGFDTVTYNNAAGVIRFHRGNVTNMGVKLLSAPLTSLYSFEWYDGYQVDSDFWTWMNHGSVQPQYASPTVEGPISITSQNSVVIPAGQSRDVYYAYALGANEQTMLANIAAAEQRYYVITSVEDNKPSANEFNLGQNIPNPFRNATTISYQIPDDGFVSLKVYNVIGSEVAALVDSKQTRGSHTVDFSSNDLTSGVYYYTLRYNNQVKTNKMFLIK
jgi:hypothetical protein